MSAVTEMKKVTNISWGTVGSVAVGIALFGLVMYGIRKLPENAVTTPVKSAAAIVG